MKKLLIMTGVAAFAFGAFAAIELPNGTGFDGATPYDSYWVVPSDVEAAATPYESGEALDVRPAYFSGDNVNYLGIESASTTSPLTRYIGTLQDQESEAIGNGLYLDTLVQFTVSTETMGASEGSNAKLAIWAQTSDETPAVTNFVVQAGYITAGDVEAHNYAMTAPADFDYTAWHRLTVKAIANIDANATTESTHVVGFVVFVDGTALTRANSATIGDEGYVPTLNTVAGKFAAAVLPSMIHTGNTKTTLQAVSFSGNGKIDDVSFTDVAPTFAADATVYTVTWGEGIASVSYNDTDLVKDAENTLPEGSFALVVTLESGYALGTPVASGCTVTANGNTFTVSGATPGASIEFTAFQPKASVTIGGNTVGFNTLKEAFDAVKSSGGTITLLGNVTVGGEDVIVPEESEITVTIDLAGNTVTGSQSVAAFTAAGGTLVITDSVGGGEVVAGEGGFAVLLAGGKVTVYGGKFTGSFEVDEGIELIGSLELYGGSYDTGTWVMTEDFDGIAKAAVTGPTDGYYTVGGEEPVEDTPVAVPTAVTGLVYDGTEQTGVVAVTGYTLTGNTGTNAGEYTATATLADGYVWADESKEAKSITWAIAKKTVTATITLAPASATYDAEKKTVDDYTDATVTFGSDTLANTDYTVTGLDTAVAEAGEFTITVAPAASGSNYTFDTVTAKLTVTAVQPTEPVEVEPGATVESDTEEAAKAVTFAAPAAVTEAGVDAEAYAALFEQKTSYNETSGKWETTYELTAEAVDDLTTEVDADVKAFDPAAAEAAFTGTPGIYYHTVSGTSVNDLTGDNNWAMAGADGSVKLTLPKAGGTSGFYKIEASATK